MPTDIDFDTPLNPILETETIATELGLSFQQLSLRKYPGAIHWHFAMPGKSGTLECTWWPKTSRYWMSVHNNRAADWQEPIIESFRQRLSK